MRIIGGTLRGRNLYTPKGPATRPTAQRTRQAIFDMLLHASWYGKEALEQAHILDVFAGTGALGLEALSRGAKIAGFIEQNHHALSVISQNIRACKMEAKTHLLHYDATRPPKRPAKIGQAADLVFLDPPYGKDLINKTVRALYRTGWIADNALIVAETEDTPKDEEERAKNPEGFRPDYAHLPPAIPKKIKTELTKPDDDLIRPEILSQRRFGAARITIWRLVPPPSLR